MTFNRIESPGYMTNLAARLFARVIDRRLKPLGVVSGQLPVFFELANRPQQSQKRLAEAAAIEQPTMAATLSRMERDGLVSKQRDPKDGRSMLYSLTPAAMEKAARVRAAIREVNALATKDLDKDERAAHLAILKKMTVALEQGLDQPD